MDISVASNFERLIYDFFLNSNSELCNKLYNNFPKISIKLEDSIWKKSSELFLSHSVDDDATIQCMKSFYEQHGFIIDPHTAVAAHAVNRLEEELMNETVILSTAHPAKFPNILRNADLKLKNIPKRIDEVKNKKEVAVNIPSSDKLIFEYIIKHN